MGLSSEAIVSAYKELTLIVEPEESPCICSDPHDDIFIAIALAAGADVIVSGDRHLLNCGERSPVPVVTASIFLAALSEATGEAPASCD